MDQKKLINEDWLSVLLAFAVIVLSLTIHIVPAPAWGWAEGLPSLVNTTHLWALAQQALLTFALSLIWALANRKSIPSFLAAFTIVFLTATLAQVLAGHAFMKSLNLEAVIFSLCAGLVIGNLVKLPAWLRNSLSAEFFVKVGLVLLGTNVLFADIMRAGALGLVQALAVVISVWYFAYWLCKKLKLDNELTMMLASAVSICGVSAAIATAGAIKGDSKKLSFVISLVLVTAIPMMIAMPYLAQLMSLPEEVTGAWLGGTIDTTGAVVAAGSLVGEAALKTSSIVKFSQNVLLGLAAFAISIYWTYRGGSAATEKPTAAVIWERFPKFVIGFVAASLLFSFIVSPEAVSLTKESLKSLQTQWFVLAFTCIGLETRFADLVKGNRPAVYAFLGAQLFNIVVTLAIAWLLFR